MENINSQEENQRAEVAPGANTGRVTIPTDLDVVDQTLEVMKQWGADALRDCDGTDFPSQLQGVGAKIYSTYYTTRKDNVWAKANPDEIQQIYIMTPFYSTGEGALSIPLMKGLYPEMLKVNPLDRQRWWEVIDRTTGEIVPPAEWEYQEAGEESRITFFDLPHSPSKALPSVYSELFGLYHVGSCTHVQCCS